MEEQNKYWTSKVEVFEGLELAEIKVAINKFNKENFVIATQLYPYITTFGHRGKVRVYDAIVYYKTPPEQKEE